MELVFYVLEGLKVKDGNDVKHASVIRRPETKYSTQSFRMTSFAHFNLTKAKSQSRHKKAKKSLKTFLPNRSQ